MDTIKGGRYFVSESLPCGSFLGGGAGTPLVLPGGAGGMGPEDREG